MKRLLLFFVCLAISILAKTQYFNGNINFENPLLVSENKPLKFEILMGRHLNNIWQVGHPQKVFFDSAYEGKNVIVTDTLLPYPINAYSYFDVKFYNMTSLGSILMANFSFYHKFETEKGKAGGYILASTDNGITWDKIIDKNNQITFCDVCQFKEAGGLYKYNDTLENGNSAFSGKSNGWQGVFIRFGSSAVKKQPFDTLIFRFVFEANNSQNPTDGWMIDNIWFDNDYTSSIAKNTNNNLSIYPNPTMGSTTFQTINNEDIQNITIKDVLGKEVYTQTAVKQNSITLNFSHLPKGCYFTIVETEKGLSTQRLILQ